MHRIILMTALALFCAGAANAGNDITITGFGRANLRAMKKAYYGPFQKATGVTVNDVTYDGQMDQLIEMVKEGKPFWDVMQVETRTLDVGCREGLFEKLDQAKIIDKKADLVPGSLTECGVGAFAWSQALVYNADKVKGKPASWADFWDVKKFPGKRGLRRSAKYTLEIALLADGVAPADIYKVLATPEGVDRAFHKLDEIKPNAIWWEAAPQPTLFLGDNRMVMTSAYTLWLGPEQRAGKNYKIVWNGSLYDFDNWAIPKGTPKIADAYKFIAFATKAANQKVFSEQIEYGPVNKKALSLLDAKLANTLPTAPVNLKGAIQIDLPFWIRYGPELEKRFEAWAPVIVRQVTDDDEHDDSAAAPHAH
jgi:putative spermidine/putrescine transport system substrate-binding protein